MSEPERDDTWYRDRGLRTPSEAALWDDLFARLRAGEIGPADAQREADDGGLGQLGCRPDAAIYDPMTRPAWTIAMAMAWILARSVEAVRESDNDYRKNCLLFEADAIVSEGDVKFGWILARPKPVTTITLGMEMELHDRLADYLQAKSELWAALFDGKVVAHGVHASRPGIETIPSAVWAYMAVRQEGDQEYLGLNHAPLAKEYHHVVLRRSEILALWPPLVEVIEDEPILPAPAERPMPLVAIRDALIQRMRVSPSRRTWTKEQFRENVPGAMNLTTPELDAIWKTAAHEAPAPAWLKGGPPPGPKTNRINPRR